MAKVKIGDDTRELEVGDRIYYVLPDGPNEGQARPAVVDELKDAAGMCDLVVTLTDEGDDAGQNASLVNKRWRKWLVQNVDHNVNKARRTWHF